MKERLYLEAVYRAAELFRWHCNLARKCHLNVDEKGEIGHEELALAYAHEMVELLLGEEVH